MNTKNKYAIVQINIPIEIYPNGEFTKHEDCISIQINEIPELPTDAQLDESILTTAIQKILSNDDADAFGTIERIPIIEETLPFIIKSSPEISPRDPPKSIIQEFIPKYLLENRTKHILKNTTFKKAPKPHRNKTRSNPR